MFKMGVTPRMTGIRGYTGLAGNTAAAATTPWDWLLVRTCAHGAHTHPFFCGHSAAAALLFPHPAILAAVCKNLDGTGAFWLAIPFCLFGLFGPHCVGGLDSIVIYLNLQV